MSLVKKRIRKNDIVQVINGADSGKRTVARGEDEKLRGKRGKVLIVDNKAERAYVEGCKMVFKHQRQGNDPSQATGGRIEREAAIKLSNLMVVCPKCDEATRISIRSETGEDAEGHPRIRRIRVCKKCGSDIPERVS